MSSVNAEQKLKPILEY